MVIADKSNGRCWYCGIYPHDEPLTRDHQQPKSRGGTGHPENLVMACRRCNNEKDNMDVETYRWFLQDKMAAGERVVFYGEDCPEPWYA